MLKILKIKNSKWYRDQLFGAFLIFIFINVLCIDSGILYNPIRLYYTGNIEMVTVTRKHSLFSGSAPQSNQAFYIEVKDYDFPIFLSWYQYRSVHEGDTLKVFLSRKLQTGFLSNRESVSLAYTFWSFREFKFISAIIIFVVVSFTSLLGLFDLSEEISKVNDKISQESTGKPEWIRKLRFAEEYVPYLLIVLCLYVVGIIAVKAVYSVEQTNRLLTGYVIFPTFIAFSLGPSWILRLRRTFSESRIIEYIILIVKIGVGAWTVAKSFIFLTQNDLTKFENLVDVLKSLIFFVFKYDP